MLRLNRKRYGLLRPFMPRQGEILEVGCGTGTFLDYLLGAIDADAHDGLAFHGVDLSTAMLHIARERDAEVTWAQADSKRLPFADGRFELVFCQVVLHHIHAELELHLREMMRVLASGGTLWLLDSNRRNPLWILVMRQPYERGAKQVPVAAVERLLRTTGAVDIRCQYHGAAPNRFPRWAESAFDITEAVVESVPLLRTFATHYLISCRKADV